MHVACKPCQRKNTRNVAFLVSYLCLDTVLAYHFDACNNNTRSFFEKPCLSDTNLFCHIVFHHGASKRSMDYLSFASIWRQTSSICCPTMIQQFVLCAKCIDNCKYLGNSNVYIWYIDITRNSQHHHLALTMTLSIGRPRREPRFLALCFFAAGLCFVPHNTESKSRLQRVHSRLRATGEDEEAWQQAYQMELQRNQLLREQLKMEEDELETCFWVVQCLDYIVYWLLDVFKSSVRGVEMILYLISNYVSFAFCVNVAVAAAVAVEGAVVAVTIVVVLVVAK